MFDVLLQDVLQVPFAQDHEVVVALDAETLCPPLGVGVQVGRDGADALHLGAVGLEHGVELPGELRVVVDEHAGRRQPQSAISIVAFRAC